MANVNNDDRETLVFADEGEYAQIADSATATLDELQTALNQGDPNAKVGDLAVALGITIEPARAEGDDRTYGYVDEIPPA